MSETETRDAPMSDVEVNALVSDARRHLRTGTGCGSCVRGVERLSANLADARAELSRLRGVVEAVQALADQALADSTEASDDPCQWRDEHDCHATARYFLAERILGALAPVPSSGEAESGEQPFKAWLDKHPEVCVTPAPVPSGVQADGEAVTGGVNYEVVAARLAARPVLSREALRERIAFALGALPEAHNVTDYTDEQTTVITADVDRIADAVLDVLTAGGEQE